MTRRTDLLVIALGLCITPAAHAERITVTQAKRIADQAWPQSPCAGRLIVVPAPWLLPLENRDGAVRDDGSCRIEIRPGLDAARRCDVIVHEAGHRAGLFLSPVPHPASGVMSEYAGPYPPCHPRGTVRAEVVRELRWLLPPPRKTWRVGCGPERRVMRCYAKRGQRVRRFRVHVRPTELLVLEGRAATSIGRITS